MWGRSLYRNIQRFILFQLTINFAAIVVFLAGSVMETEMPLTVTQILWVNIIMDTLAAMAMASLPPQHEVMRERPRRRDASIVSRAMVRTIATCGSIFVVVLLGMLGWWLTTGEPTVRQLTVFFTTFVFLQFWNLFNAKAIRSRMRGEPRHRAQPDVPHRAGAHRAGAMAHRRTGRRGLPHRPALVAGVGLDRGAPSLIALGGEAIRALRRWQTCSCRDAR